MKRLLPIIASILLLSLWTIPVSASENIRNCDGQTSISVEQGTAHVKVHQQCSGASFQILVTEVYMCLQENEYGCAEMRLLEEPLGSSWYSASARDFTRDYPVESGRAYIAKSIHGADYLDGTSGQQVSYSYWIRVD